MQFRCHEKWAQLLQEVKDLLRHYFMVYSGFGGLTEQDDVESWNAATADSQKVIARRLPSTYQMGMRWESLHKVVPGTATISNSEQNEHGFYKRQAECIMAKSRADLLLSSIRIG